MPLPAAVWFAVCVVPAVFPAFAAEAVVFDWSTEPSLPLLSTRTGELVFEGWTWSAAESAPAPWSVQPFCFACCTAFAPAFCVELCVVVAPFVAFAADDGGVRLRHVAAVAGAQDPDGDVRVRRIGLLSLRQRVGGLVRARGLLRGLNRRRVTAPARCGRPRRGDGVDRVVTPARRRRRCRRRSSPRAPGRRTHTAIRGRSACSTGWSQPCWSRCPWTPRCWTASRCRRCPR